MLRLHLVTVILIIIIGVQHAVTKVAITADMPNPFLPIEQTPHKLGFGKNLPEWGKNVSQVIGDVYNYPVEVHNVTTDDGYILSLQRIPHGINQKPEAKSRPCILLQHGLLSTSVSWIVNLPHQSLAYVLADSGYDVWLGNIRGNSYGLHHTRLNSTQKEFWDFTWQDMAEHDLPAMLEHITSTTGQSQCHYVGHSQGTLIAFAALSTNPAFSKMIKSFTALAPVHNLGNIGKSSLKELAKHTKEIVFLLNSLGDYSSGQVTWILNFIKPICWFGPEYLDACENTFLQIMGPEHKDHINMTRMPLIIEHMPDTTSVKNVAHFGQLVEIGNQMRKYDYGPMGNWKHYKQISVPVYDVTTITNEMVFFYSAEDELADAIDVIDLIGQMPNVHLHKMNDYSHCDFIWSLDAKQRVYDPLMAHLTDWERRHR